MNTFTSIQKSRTLFFLFILIFTSLTGAFSVSAQTEYQSRATGNWTNSGTGRAEPGTQQLLHGRLGQMRQHIRGKIQEPVL